MKNPFGQKPFASLFRSVLQFVCPTRRISAEPSLTPEQFRRMLAETLAANADDGQHPERLHQVAGQSPASPSRTPSGDVGCGAAVTWFLNTHERKSSIVNWYSSAMFSRISLRERFWNAL